MREHSTAALNEQWHLQAIIYRESGTFIYHQTIFSSVYHKSDLYKENFDTQN